MCNKTSCEVFSNKLTASRGTAETIELLDQFAVERLLLSYSPIMSDTVTHAMLEKFQNLPTDFVIKVLF